MTIFASATSAQQEDALHAWCAARTADGNPPSQARISRVRTKLPDQAAYLLVGSDGDRVVAMTLSEPYRERQGTGAVQPHAGHVSVVFVDPGTLRTWRRGRLLDVLHREMRARGWMTSSLWTRSSNVSQRLYEGRGYRLTDDIKHLSGHEIVRYELRFEDSLLGARVSARCVRSPLLREAMPQSNAMRTDGPH